MKIFTRVNPECVTSGCLLARLFFMKISNITVLRGFAICRDEDDEP